MNQFGWMIADPICSMFIFTLIGFSDVFIGTLKLEVAAKADAKYILSHTHNIFTQVGVCQLYVQMDYAAI
ncbi:zinc transporter 7-A-like isoform X6 [Tachypleus tridentatus]|uniref:zinc transporter 7-A-like isoform X6 n=1 Tax=Tachypleus tridentatus TaxID=6853 RepID=UPI003FD3698C